MKLFKNIFKKSIIRLVSFYNAGEGIKEHDEFINWVNKNNVKIINSYITYHSGSNSHKPQHINYVIKYK